MDRRFFLRAMAGSNPERMWTDKDTRLEEAGCRICSQWIKWANKEHLLGGDLNLVDHGICHITENRAAFELFQTLVAFGWEAFPAARYALDVCR